MLVIYELVKQTEDEEYRDQGENNKDIIKWFEKNENVHLSTQHIYNAKKKGGIVVGKYRIYDIDLDDEDW